MIPGPNLIYKCPKCGKCTMSQSISSGNTFNSKLYSDGKLIAPMLPQFSGITKCKICKTIYWLNKKNKIGEYSSGWGDRNKINLVKIGIPVGSKLVFCESEYADECKSDNPIDVELVTGYRVKYNEKEYTISNLTNKLIGFHTVFILSFWKYRGELLIELFDNVQYLSKDEYIEAISLKVYHTKAEEKYLRAGLWRAFNNMVRDGNKVIFSDSDKSIYESNCVKLIGILGEHNENEKIMCAELYRNLGNYTKCENILETIHEEEYYWIKKLLKKECKRKNKKVIVLRDESDPY